MSAQTFARGIRKDWTTEAGLRAVVLMTEMGHHCGYVALPAGHPLHGVGYSEPCGALAAPSDDAQIGKPSPLALLCAAVDADRMRSPEIVFDVHGGITYSGGGDAYPADGAGLWWFGFDCAHLYDRACDEYIQTIPEERRWLYERDGEFRDLDFCVNECESLARQIANATGSAA